MMLDDVMARNNKGRCSWVHMVSCFDTQCVHWVPGEERFRMYHDCGLNEPGTQDYVVTSAMLSKHTETCDPDAEPPVMEGKTATLQIDDEAVGFVVPAQDATPDDTEPGSVLECD